MKSLARFSPTMAALGAASPANAARRRRVTFGIVSVAAVLLVMTTAPPVSA